MIQLYSGPPGSGKSLHVAHDIKDYLCMGKRVISTCMIDTDLCFLGFFKRRYVNRHKKKPKKIKPDKRAENFVFIPIEEITPAFLYEYAAKHHVFGKEHQTVVILDECVAIFSPTVIGDDKKRWNEWEDFFRKHRHIGYDVIMIPQHESAISRKCLFYTEYNVKHYNRKNQGIFGWILSLILGGLFSYSTHWRGIRSKPLDQGFFTYKPYYGLMYNSYSMFNETLQPYKDKAKQEQKKRQELLSKLCLVLNERVIQLESTA